MLDMLQDVIMCSNCGRRLSGGLDTFGNCGQELCRDCWFDPDLTTAVSLDWGTPTLFPDYLPKFLRDCAGGYCFLGNAKGELLRLEYWCQDDGVYAERWKVVHGRSIASVFTYEAAMVRLSEGKNRHSGSEGDTWGALVDGFVIVPIKGE
jgi:hypothetical protein